MCLRFHNLLEKHVQHDIQYKIPPCTLVSCNSFTSGTSAPLIYFIHLYVTIYVIKCIIDVLYTRPF